MSAHAPQAFLALALATLAVSACSAPPPTARPSHPAAPSAPRSYGEGSDAALQECLTDKGWRIEVKTDGGFEVKTPPEQQQKFLSDQQQCAKLYEQAHPPPKLTVSDFRALYQQELATMRCLAKAGYPASTSPISEQQYVDEYASGKAPSWYAYLVVGNLSGDAFAEVQKKCPQPRVAK